MYADGGKGVRIEFDMPFDFNQVVYTFIDGNRVDFTQEIISSSGIAEHLMRTNDGYIPLDFIKVTDVVYSNDELEKRKYVNEVDYGSIKFKSTTPIVLVGIKGEAWSYENETIFYSCCSTFGRLNIEYLFFEFNESMYDRIKVVFSLLLSEKKIEDY